MSSLPGLDGPHALYAALVLLLAYVVRGVAGFGSGLIAVPSLTMVAPVGTVVPVVVSLDYIGSAGQGVRHLGRVAWVEQLALFPFTLVGVATGLLVLRGVSATLLSRTLGVFVIVYAVYQLLPLPPLHGSRIFAIVCGFMGGLVGTLFGTGGPFYAMYFNLRGLDKSAFRATFAVNFMIDGGVRLAGYALAGLLGWAMLIWVAAALPLVALGLYAGGRVHVSLSQRAFVRLVSVILVAAGAALLIR
ncbi:MAG TPA: sulfite exporter TauE/SafE family protein [Candidatus Acidoferrum sp.]|nr:sulfite exporter TauE/SafE family protein [Candidatus Acidoferrum sp.]